MFKELFNPHGNFATYGTKAFNVIFLSAIWTTLSFFSAGILMGYATVGVYKGAYGGVAPGNGFAMFYFFRPLKQFKSRWATLIIAPFLNFLVIVSSGFGLFLIFNGILDMTFMIPIYIVVFIEGIMISLYTMPLIAHSHIGFKDLFYYAFGLANKHLVISLIGLVTTLSATALVALITYITPVPLPYLMFTLPALVFSLNGYLVVHKVFPKYDLERFGLDVEA